MRTPGLPVAVSRCAGRGPQRELAAAPRLRGSPRGSPRGVPLNVVQIAVPGPFGVGGLESVVVGLALGIIIAIVTSTATVSHIDINYP